MQYYATSEIMEAIAGQVRDQIGTYLDDVILFDGSLEQAINDHFSQPTKAGLKTILFIALSEDVADTLSGSGTPIRLGHLVDFFVVVRTDGKSRYTKDRERLYGVSDALMFTVFDCPNRAPEYIERVAAHRFQFRRRAAADGDLMAHLVRFQFNARTP